MMSNKEQALLQIGILRQTEDGKQFEFVINKLLQDRSKRLRVKADYKDEDFSCKDSEKSLSLATDIENKIKKYL